MTWQLHAGQAKWLWLALAGAALGVVYPPSPLGWLAPLPLALLFRAVYGVTPVVAFSLTLVFAASFFTVLLWWLPQSLGALLGWGLVAVFPVLVFLLSVMWALTVSLARWWAGPRTWLALPLAWVVLDTLREMGPFGFPWGNLGYFLSMTPLVQVTEWGGVPLLSLLVGLAASALAVWSWRGLLILPAWGLALLFGILRPAESPAFREALLVQGNIDPRVKLAGQAALDWNRYLTLTRRASAETELVIWPETAVSWPEPAQQAALSTITSPLLFGASMSAVLPRNTALLTWQGTVLGAQDKLKLVPFGEYFPAQRTFPQVYRAAFRALGLPELTGRVPGAALRPLATGPVRAGVLICYESVFPSLARSRVQQGANVLVTPSNDAWFGSTRGAEQHFQMGRVRAIETRRWWLRAGNDGITAAVDPQGRVVRRLERFRAGVLPVQFELLSGQTFSVQFPDWLSWMSLTLLLGMRVRWPLQVMKGTL